MVALSSRSSNVASTCPASTLSPSRTNTCSMRPPTLEPTRISRASTVPEATNGCGRDDAHIYAATPRARTIAITISRLRVIVESSSLLEGWRPFLQGPEKHGPKQRLLKTEREVLWLFVARNLTAVLPFSKHLLQSPSPGGQAQRQEVAYSFARQENRKQASHHLRTASRLGRKSVVQPVQRIPSLLRAGQGGGLVVLGPLHLAEDAENVLFTGQVVKERPFAHIGRVGDVLHGGVVEAALTKQIHGRAEQTLPSLRTPPFAAAHLVLTYGPFENIEPIGLRLRSLHNYDYRSYMSNSQV